jgi:hypothetical protein
MVRNAEQYCSARAPLPPKCGRLTEPEACPQTRNRFNNDSKTTELFGLWKGLAQDWLIFHTVGYLRGERRSEPVVSAKFRSSNPPLQALAKCLGNENSELQERLFRVAAGLRP